MAKWKVYIRIAEWLLCAAAMVYLVYRLWTYEHYGDLSNALFRMDVHSWILLLGACICIPVQLWVEALRWQAAVRGWKTISIRESWSQVLIGMVAGFVTPYRAGDIPARLLEAGLDIPSEELTGRWHDWVRDWRKWWSVIGFTALRYVVWGIQLWAVLEALGIYMPILDGVKSIAFYYFVISIMPVLPVADVAMKGGWAVWIFGAFSDDVAAIMVAVSIIWIINTLIPVFFGGLKKILYFCRQK